MEEMPKTTRRDWIVVVLIGLCSAGAIWGLFFSPLGQTALLYVTVPALVSIAVWFLVPNGGIYVRGGQRFRRHQKYVWSVFAIASVTLLEGFICALMFAPIYFVIVSLTFFLLSALDGRAGTKLQAGLLPVLALVGGIEGTTPGLTFDRSESVTVTRVVAADPAMVWDAIRVPDGLPAERHWFLTLFPLPDAIDAEVIAAGETHVLGFTYDRWFVTNTHTGEMHIEVVEAGPAGLRTTITHDDSYLSHYMKMEGTELALAPAPGGGTAVTLTIRYERALDPAWYFAPLQNFAVARSADYLIGAVTAEALPPGPA